MASFPKPLLLWSKLIQERAQRLQAFAFYVVTIFDEHTEPSFIRKPRVNIEI